MSFSVIEGQPGLMLLAPIRKIYVLSNTRRQEFVQYIPNIPYCEYNICHSYLAVQKVQ